MRKAASKLRREERAVKKNRQKRVAAATKRLAKQHKHVAAKVARKRRPAERIMEGLKDAAVFTATDGKEGGNIINPNRTLKSLAREAEKNGEAVKLSTESAAAADGLADKIRSAELDARFEGERAQMRHQNDDIVCSLISMIKHACGMPRHAPWEISGAEMRAVIEVLERAGYSEFGRIDTAEKGPSATNAAS